MIQISGLQKNYGDHRVLHGVDLQVQKGEVVCLIGPSGSGKSTLLRCINALETYEGGSILAFGETVQRGSKTVHTLRSRMGMVFQRFNLFPHRTVLENVMEGPLYVKNEPAAQVRREALALLDKVGLAEKADAYPEQLSGGQQQRVAIARALAHQPGVVVADEPTGNLDLATGEAIMDLLLKINQQTQTTFIVSTHSTQLKDRAKRVIEITDGELTYDSAR